MLKTLADTIDRGSLILGRSVAWLVIAMVLLMAFSVVQRYLFHTNHIWQTELVVTLHGMVFLLGASYTLHRNTHVRVDILYERFSDKTKAVVDLLGTLLFLFPVCGTLLYFSWDFVLTSWSLGESSAEYDGLPFTYLYKTCLWVFAVTMILQGVSTVIRSIFTLQKTP